MAVGDVWTFDFRMGRKEVAMRPGRYLVIAKGWFQQTFPDHTDNTTFGYLQLIFGYGGLLRTLDEGVAYLGAVGWANPADPSTIEGTRGGAVVVDAIVQVEAQAGPKPEPGRLVVQAGAEFARLHNGRLVVMQIAKVREPISFRFAIPLSAVKSIESPEAVRRRLARQAGGSSGNG